MIKQIKLKQFDLIFSMICKLIDQILILFVLIVQKNELIINRNMEMILQKNQSFNIQHYRQPSALKVTTITFSKQENCPDALKLQWLRSSKSHNKSNPMEKTYSDEYIYRKYKNNKCHHHAKISQMFFVKSINLTNKPSISKEKEKINLKCLETRILKSNAQYDKNKKVLEPLQKSILKKINTPINEDYKAIQRQKQRSLKGNMMMNISKTKSSENYLRLNQLSCKDAIFQTKFHKYKQQLEKGAQLHNISITFEDYPTNLKYFVGKGNNSRLIKEVMKKRWWWNLSEDKNNINFMWLQLKDKLFYEISRSTSKSSDSFSTCNTQLSSSKVLARSSKSDRRKTFQFEIQKNSSSVTLQKAYSHSCSTPSYIPERNKISFNKYAVLMHNHYQHNQFLGNKKALYYNMSAYYNSLNLNVFDYLPLTYHITSLQDKQFVEFQKRYEIALANSKKQKLWILKPGENSNRGRGITIHSDLQYIKKHINQTKKKQQNVQKGKARTFIIQQYIEKPFLYNKRKFDIRCYIMLCSLNESVKGYWYKQGYIRTSCFDFTLDSFNNNLVHLTNDAVQKNCEQYGKYEPGNKLSYSAFKRYLAFKYNKKFDFDTQIYEEIRKIAIDTIKAAYRLIKGNTKKNVFEIFGLDFMIDQNFKPWLIEVNTNPCLQTSCQVLQKIIPKMLDDAFKLSIDIMFPPPENWPNSKKHLLGTVNTNQFQLVFEQNKEENLKEISFEQIGEIEEDDEIYEEQ